MGPRSRQTAKERRRFATLCCEAALLQEGLVQQIGGIMRKWGNDESSIFQVENDSKPTLKIVAKWLQEKRVKVLEWSSQSSDLDPKENFWEELKKHEQGGLKT